MYFYGVIYFWLHLAFVATHRDYSQGGVYWLLLFWSMSSRQAGSVVVARGLSCLAAYGIFPG